MDSGNDVAVIDNVIENGLWFIVRCPSVYSLHSRLRRSIGLVFGAASYLILRGHCLFDFFYFLETVVYTFELSLLFRLSLFGILRNVR